MSSESSGSLFPSIRHSPLSIWCAHAFSPSWNRKPSQNCSHEEKKRSHAQVCVPTLRHSSIFPVLVLLFGSGSSMSTFRLHDTVAQEEHKPDWYFQSAGLATLWENIINNNNSSIVWKRTAQHISRLLTLWPTSHFKRFNSQPLINVTWKDFTTVFVKSEHNRFPCSVNKTYNTILK